MFPKKIFQWKHWSSLFTFMYISTSRSGVILSAISLLDSSDSKSAHSQNNTESCLDYIYGSYFFLFSITWDQKEFFIKVKSWLTVTWSNPLTPCWESQGFPYGHFSNMKIMLASIGSSSLGYKLIHFMAIISHSPSNL